MHCLTRAFLAGTPGGDPVIERLTRDLADLLPLTIREATYADDTLTIAGDGWAFSALCPWRVVRDGVLLYAWSDPAADDRVWDLCGQQVLAVSAQSSAMPGDPRFELSTGELLEIFSDHAVDPWVLRLPNTVYVGSPSAADHKD